MAGIKGQKSGGFGGRKPLNPDEKREKYINFKVTESEKKLIDEARGNRSLAEFFLDLIKSK